MQQYDGKKATPIVYQSTHSMLKHPIDYNYLKFIGKFHVVIYIKISLYHDIFWYSGKKF